MDEVKRGMHPSIQRIKHISERFGIDHSFLGKKLPEETKMLRELLSQRRQMETAHKHAAREIVLTRAVHSATKQMINSGVNITRRTLTEMLTQQGISLRRTEFKFALAAANASAKGELTANI